jgi:poly(A) polymerase
MKLAPQPWQDAPGMDRLLRALDAAGKKTRFVGGCVRDSLIGAEVSDVDLATALRPEEVLARLERARIKAVPTGIAHGTVTAVIAGRPVEVTTLRRDVATDGRRATIAYTDDWREDAARRDFTINALSADPEDGAIHDYFGGLDDLKAGRVRFIGDPLVRIAEDHLRILRFFRFHARYGRGAPDAEGLAACAARANDLMALSRERISDEFLKLLGLPDPAATVATMIDRSILKSVLPEITGAERLEALIAAERAAGIEPAAIRRFAALLPPDPELAIALAARLRLSKRLGRRLADAVAPGIEPPEVLAYRIGRDAAIDRLLLAGRTGPEVAALNDWQRPTLPIRGGELIAMGLVAGPLVAATMQRIEEAWIRDDFPRDRRAVQDLARRLVDQALRDSAKA